MKLKSSDADKKLDILESVIYIQDKRLSEGRSCWYWFEENEWKPKIKILIKVPTVYFINLINYVYYISDIKFFKFMKSKLEVILCQINEKLTA